MPTARRKIGYNVLRVPDKGALMQHLSELRPAGLLFYQGEVQFAREVRRAFPETEVILRHWPDTEMKETPLSWLMSHKAAGWGDLVLYTTNEPALNDHLLNWHYELMRYCIEQKTRLCILNLAAGTWGPDDGLRMEKVLRLASEHRDLFMVGLHEYATGVITSGLIGGAPDAIQYHRNFITRENWPMPAEAAGMTRWHVGRHKFLTDFCRARGFAPPRIVVTEFGWDFLSDLASWTSGLPAFDGYTAINGFRTLEAAWRRWWPQWGRDEAAVQQINWAEGALLGEVEMALLFCLGNDGSWGNYDVWGTDIPKLLATSIPTLPIPPVVVPPPAPGPDTPPDTEPESPAPKPNPTPAAVLSDLRVAFEYLESAIRKLESQTGG